jgi:rubrerythrin
MSTASLFLNAGDIFEIAVQIERNGARFYREAAAAVSDPESATELKNLAAMEDEHEIMFLNMKKDLMLDDGDVEWFLEDDDAVQYLQSFAKGQVFDLTRSTAPALAADMDLKVILAWAVERERDSIVFYAGIKELVPESLGSGKIDIIIKQEMAHVALLNRRLLELSR